MTRDKARITHVAAALAGGWLLVAATFALAQEDQAPRMGRGEALEYMTAFLAARPQITLCGPARLFSSDSYQRVAAFEFSDIGLTITCPDGERTMLAFAQAQLTDFGPIGRLRFFALGGAHFVARIDNIARLAAAWTALRRPLPLDPATDAAFQAALHRAMLSTADRTEDRRRAQVRAEAFIGTGRTADALDVYQNALTAAPDWAAGHYNAALVAAELEQYELAITEMRRYLYLEPTATDVRAAQDQIYRWEALLE